MKLKLESAYQNLLTDPFEAFVFDPNLENFRLSTYNKPDEIHVFPGSYNPLHDAHRAIFDGIRCPNDCKFFEISIERIGKERLSCIELAERLDQFKNYAPVLVTRAPRFIEKAGILRGCHPTFHVGGDTIFRMIQDYGDIGIQGIAARFVVYDRKVDNTVLGAKNILYKLENVSVGKIPNEALLEISSTKIRAQSKDLQVPLDGSIIDGQRKKV